MINHASLLALQEGVLDAVGAAGAPDAVNLLVSGIEPERLKLVGELAKAKRLAKIEAVLPRTCHALGTEFLPVANEFVLAHPATSSRSRADALKLYRFLRGRWPRFREPAPYLIDLAYCELALSSLVRPSPKQNSGPSWEMSKEKIAIRRQIGVRLRTCAFDMRRLFENDDGARDSIPEVQTHLAIVSDPPVGDPRIVRISVGMFGFLRSLRVWNFLPGITNQRTTKLLHKLERLGFVEILERKTQRPET